MTLFAVPNLRIDSSQLSVSMGVPCLRRHQRPRRCRDSWFRPAGRPLVRSGHSMVRARSDTHSGLPYDCTTVTADPWTVTRACSRAWR